MSKTADLLFRVTNGLVLQDQWRMPRQRDGVVAMVKGDPRQLHRNAEALAHGPGRRDDNEVFYHIEGLDVAIFSSSQDHAFVTVLNP